MHAARLSYCEGHLRTDMSFSITDGGNAPALNATRLKRQLTEQAIAAATAAEWEQAADLNKRILEMGGDSEAENRLAKAYWEMGELAQAREHYQAALALDPTNRIAERNISRLRMLLNEAGKKTIAAK
jgi:tetratricopeptide (TPR) repeat protein